MNSHRQILKSSAIIGGSTVIAVAIGIVKVKVLAVLLGAAGVGLMGVFLNIMSVASTAAGCGLGISGVRQLAASEGEPATLDAVRHALLRGNIILGLLGGIALWFARVPVSYLVFEDHSHATEVGILGVGVWLTLLAASQTALLRGLRHIGNLAKVHIIGAVFGAVTGIGFAYWMGDKGIIWFVITAPMTAAIAGAWYAAKLPKPVTHTTLTETKNQLKTMLKLGVPFMLTGLLTLATQFLARTIIIRDLGLDAAGHFQAAWAISMQYIGFVLGAMSTDYYPRLSAAIANPAAAQKLVSEQTEMAMLLAIPALLVILVTAHWIIYILYSANFEPAVTLLRWQTLGNIFKVASWPMGFILLARRQGGWFIAIEVIWDVTYLLTLYFGLSQWGLDATGIGFSIAYFLIFLVLIPLSKMAINFRFSAKWKIRIFFLSIFSISILIISNFSDNTAFVAGLAPMALICYLCYQEINKLVDISGWINTRFFKRKNAN